MLVEVDNAGLMNFGSYLHILPLTKYPGKHWHLVPLKNPFTLQKLHTPFILNVLSMQTHNFVLLL